MGKSIEFRPSECIPVRPTTPKNKNFPLYIGHDDSDGLRRDYHAAVQNRRTGLLGSVLDPVVEGATRQSVLQSNRGGEIVSNTKLVVRNAFPYEMRSDDHHPPADWKTFSSYFLAYDRYVQELVTQFPGTYMTVTNPDGLTVALQTTGRIGMLKSVEGMPQSIDTTTTRAAEFLASRDTKIVDLMWNYNTDVGDSHTTSEDKGLSRKGAKFLRACADAGIPVFDVSHASEKTALGMLKVVGPNRRVIASHTGARIGSVSEKSRNITDDVAKAIFERDGIVGVATAAGMLGGNTLGHVVSAIEHFVSIDPTGGRLVTLGHDLNGLGVESMVKGATKITESRKLAEALSKAGFSKSMIEDIFINNATDFWDKALREAKKPA